jgi:YfiH family protein
VGDHVGDDPTAVVANRARIAAALDLPAPAQWGWMQQVHGADVVVLDAPPPVPPVADALVTRTRSMPIAVMTADCAPIALANDSAVAVVHAGHRGLLAGVVANAVDALHDTGRGDVHALLGPCIHAPRYEFGADDLGVLVDEFGPEVAARTVWGTRAFDLPAAVKIALARAGVRDVHDTDTCTSASPDYFSYRRDGVTGRQVTIAMLP